MLAAAIDFGDGMDTCVSVASVRQTNLHAHPGVIEIIYVLRGSLRVQVSFEQFVLEKGDFVVVNQGDPHILAGSEDNVTAFVHLDVASFTDVDPFVADIIFACESFDLPRYREEEMQLRSLLLDILDESSLAVLPDAPSRTGRARVRQFIQRLCTSYSLDNYYHRHRDASAAQRAKFHTIVRYLNAHAETRDVLGAIASDHHYSKSWVSHLVKDVSAISFSGLLTFVRVSKAEGLLLQSDSTMVEVSAACGFSDVKYFTRAFVDWFHVSPAEYRRQMRPEMSRPVEVCVVPVEQARELIGQHRRRAEMEPAQPRLSITPLVLKNIGSRLDLFTGIGDAAPNLDAACDTAAASAVRHLVPIEADLSTLERNSLSFSLRCFDRLHATPCLVVRFSTKQVTRKELERLRARLDEAGSNGVAIWLIYNATRDHLVVDELVAYATDDLDLRIQPILQP